MGGLNNWNFLPSVQGGTQGVFNGCGFGHTLRVWPNGCGQGLDGCGQAKTKFNWVWLGFLMGVVNVFKDGCGQAKKVSTGCGQPLDGCGTTPSHTHKVPP